MWIARDENGCLWVYKNKPVKKKHNWDSDDIHEKSPFSCDMKEFRDIKWSDKKPKRLILEQADKHPEPLWISVKERLPEDDFNCIITNEYGRGVNIAYYVKEDKLWLLAYSGETVHGVTHWMKVPEII